MKLEIGIEWWIWLGITFLLVPFMILLSAIDGHLYLGIFCFLTFDVFMFLVTFFLWLWDKPTVIKP